MGTQLPSPKRGHGPPPQFSACLLWPNGCVDQDGTWHGGGPWSTPHCARWGLSSPPQKGDRAPIFSPFWATICKTVRPMLSHRRCLSVTLVYCGQTVRRIKMKLGMQVGLGPDHIVLDGDPASPSPKRHSPPQFSVHICCGQMAGWIKRRHLVWR